MKAVNITVRGRVQGVYFRASTTDKAIELGIKGWCSNQSDGSVLIHAEGDEETLADFESWCRKGPMMASVVELTKQEVESEAFSAFAIRY
ncbi:MAG: acylphosphatase [Roseivirga sp.]